MKNQGAEQLRTAADQAVAAFEAVVLGAPFAAALETAVTAFDALMDEAKAVIIAGVEPVGADVLADLEFYSERSLRQSYGADLVTIHQRAVIGHPALARVLRSATVLDRVADYAAERGASVDREVAKADYLRAVAAHLVGMVEYEPHATTIAIDAPALQARIDACRSKHETHVAAELRRIDAERLAGERAVADAEAATVAGLVEYFSARSSRGFVVKGEMFSGKALVDAARRTGVRDQSGYFVPFTLAELVTARDREIAADLAVQEGGVR